MFMVVQAASRFCWPGWAPETDIPVGVPVAGRPDEALDGLAGFFVNTLVLRTRVGAADVHRAARPGAGGGAGRVRASGCAVRAAGRDLRPERSLSRHPLFQVMLAFQNNPRPHLDLPGAAVSQLPASTATAPSWTWSSAGGSAGRGRARRAGRRGAATRTELFERGGGGAVAGRLVRVLEQVAADPGLRVYQVSLLSDAERAELAA